MSERVVYCPEASAGALATYPHRTLGRLEHGFWVAVEDQVLLAGALASVPLSLLYLSMDGYLHAIRHLPSDDVARAVQFRLERWAPRALNDSFDWLYRRMRRCLTLTAFVRAISASDNAAILEEHFEHTLGRLTSMLGEGRYDEVPLPTLLGYVLDGEVSLREEYRLAGAAEGQETSSLWSELISLRQQYAEELAGLLVRLGQPEYGQALPYVQLEHVVFIQPSEPELALALQARRRLFVVWGGGVVTAWPVRKRAELEAQGKTVTVLYLSEGEFAADLEELTPAQLDRELTERRRGRATTPSAHDSHMHAAQLEQLLLKRAVLERARGQDPAVAVALAEQTAKDGEALSVRLAERPRWLEESPPTAGDAIAELVASEESIAQDARLLAELARQANHVALQARLLAFLARQYDERARLSTLSA